VLVCGGFEPSGRAGVLADLEAVRASGGVGLGVAASLTAQGDRTFLLRPVAPAVLRRQIRALRELGGTIDAVKLGAIPSPKHLAAIRSALAGQRGWWVVDPVTRSSRGESLSTLRHYWRLAGPRTVITPNLQELEWLAPGKGDVEASAARLLDRGFAAVVVKGGHSEGARAIDWIVTQRGVVRLSARRIPRTAAVRGTGCRFASALATGLGGREALETAVRKAKRLVGRFIRSSRR
jgi:hydroxymethylpyrimidine/phosphomethylpyrimidine kinase